MQKDYEIAIRWTAFPLHPETPEEGLALEDLFAGRSVDINGIMTRLRQVADEEGLQLRERKKTYNSRLAQELGKWAEVQGRGNEFHKAVFRAYFVEGKNIAEILTLIDLAKSVELSGKEAQRVLEKRAFKEAVDVDWSHAHAMGVTAVPSFVINEQALVGFQPYEALEQLMKANGVKRNTG